MPEAYRLTPDEVLGSFNDAVKANFFKLEIDAQEEINRSKSPDQFMAKFASYGKVLFDGKTLIELESLIDDINSSPLAHRIGSNRLLGFLEGQVSMLHKIPDMTVADIVRLTDRFLPLRTD